MTAKKPIQKKFQKKTKYQGYDLDGDGTITDEELAMATAIKEEEAALRKQLTQKRMAVASLIFMAGWALLMAFGVSESRAKSLESISSMIMLSGAGIAGAFMGMSAWMSRK
jgi:hypothetical protein